MRRTQILCLLLVPLLLSACNPRVRVVKTAGDDEVEGVRYYRPKPYLFISPVATTTIEESKDKEGKTTKTTKRSPAGDTFVTLELQYLPDFSEEYAIQVSAGMGVNNTEITLDDGWNLTKLDQELDSQFDDNVTAIAELAKAAAGFVPTGARTDESGGKLPDNTTYKVVVQATNIPLGYYESIIGPDGYTGQKRLFGWRYVGFAPFNACPTDITCFRSVTCDDPDFAAVYGLAFEEGVMVFKALGELKCTSRGERTNFMLAPTGEVKSGDDASEGSKRVNQSNRPCDLGEVAAKIRSVVVAAANLDPQKVDVSAGTGTERSVWSIRIEAETREAFNEASNKANKALEASRTEIESFCSERAPFKFIYGHREPS